MESNGIVLNGQNRQEEIILEKRNLLKAKLVATEQKEISPIGTQANFERYFSDEFKRPYEWQKFVKEHRQKISVGNIAKDQEFKTHSKILWLLLATGAHRATGQRISTFFKKNYFASVSSTTANKCVLYMLGEAEGIKPDDTRINIGSIDESRYIHAKMIWGLTWFCWDYFLSDELHLSPIDPNHAKNIKVSDNDVAYDYLRKAIGKAYPQELLKNLSENELHSLIRTILLFGKNILTDYNLVQADFKSSDSDFLVDDFILQSGYGELNVSKSLIGSSNYIDQIVNKALLLEEI